MASELPTLKLTTHQSIRQSTISNHLNTLHEMSESQFRVIIIGGSIGGLALAHCLHRAGIDHIVLEKSRDAAPQVGASIGILPNGARVLDQLQLYDAVESLTEPLSTATISYADGFSFSSSYPRTINERCGSFNSCPRNS